MKELLYLIFFPFILMYYMLKLTFYLMVITFYFCFIFGKIIFSLFLMLFQLVYNKFGHGKIYFNYPDFKIINPFHKKSSSKKSFSTNSTKKNNFESSFDREAKLWGLSEEDKRIAKEERMSPADYVEAEERDDDELVTDEWEEK